eukprot:7874656-Lingulodinium_polyedra.AAC.1
MGDPNDAATWAEQEDAVLTGGDIDGIGSLPRSGDERNHEDQKLPCMVWGTGDRITCSNCRQHH